MPRLVLILLIFIGVVQRVYSAARPLVIAHRGTAYLPELTLSTLSMAHAFGPDIIEIDVCLSRDDQLVVTHDIYLDAVSNVAGVFPDRNNSDGLYHVIDFDLAELRQLRIHERVRPSNGTQVYPLRFPSNASVPFQLATLNETIELMLGLNYATGRRRDLLVEIKKPEYHAQYNKDISSLVLSTLNAYNLTELTDPVIIQTFHIEELMRIRRTLNSRLRLYALMTLNRINESSSNYDYYRTEEGIRNLSSIVQALTPFHEFLVNYDANGNILGVTNFTRWAHQYRLQVYPFTFRKDSFPGTNFEEFLHYFWHTARVDGFITDHPDVVLEYLNRHTALSDNTNNQFHNSASHARSSIVLLIFTVISVLKLRTFFFHY